MLVLHQCSHLLDIIKNLQYLKTKKSLLIIFKKLDIIKNLQYLKTAIMGEPATWRLDIIKNLQYLKTRYDPLI